MTFNTWRPWAVFLPSGNLVVNMFEIYLTEVKKMWVLNRICEEKNRYFKKTTVGSEQLSELFSYKYSRTSSIWISTVPENTHARATVLQTTRNPQFNQYRYNNQNRDFQTNGRYQNRGNFRGRYQPRYSVNYNRNNRNSQHHQNNRNGNSNFNSNTYRNLNRNNNHARMYLANQHDNPQINSNNPSNEITNVQQTSSTENGGVDTNPNYFFAQQ